MAKKTARRKTAAGGAKPRRVGTGGVGGARQRRVTPPAIDSERVKRAGEAPARTPGGLVVPRAGNTANRLRDGGGRRTVGLGWLPDLPDNRDWSYKKLREHAGEALAKRSKEKFGRTLTRKNHASLGMERASSLPSFVDHRSTGWLSPIEDQGDLGSCTAHAVVGMLEFLMRRVNADHIDLSRLFLYKVSRNLMGVTGDTGSYIRTVIKATRVFGVPPESQWAYDVGHYDEEPIAYLYAYASNFKSTMFGRLDPYNETGKDALQNIKEALASGNCAAFGFPVYRSIESPRNWYGEVPYPRRNDRAEGGHAVLAVGYDDDLEVESRGGRNKKGALIFRNSWSTDWGDDGYGYMPYAYVEDQLAVDWWAVYNADWVNEQSFEE